MSLEILSGNELIVQGGLEAGFKLFTGYPGSPLADYFNILHKKRNQLKENGIQVVIANSEANAAAMASGAKMSGQDCLVAMKSMGLHVASDALSVGNFADPGDGIENQNNKKRSSVVIVVGDDSWSISTSTPADSRFLYKHLHIPFLEPSNPQELKDWFKKAKHLSSESSVYTGILLTTFLAEGGGRVECSEINYTEKDKELVTLNTKEFDLQKNVMVPPNSLFADKRMIESRFPKILETLESMNLDQVFGNKESDVGFICAGSTFTTLKQFFESYSLLDLFSIYKLASSYPLVPNLLKDYLKNKKMIVVVEEKRGFIESELKELVNDLGLTCKIVGKKFNDKNGFPAFGGLNFEILESKFQVLKEEFDLQVPEKIQHGILSIDIPRRLPTFCPGCPHRETLSLMKELRKQFEKKGVNLLSHGDVGCYSLAFLEPFKEMHDLSAMGQGGAMAAGSDLFATNPSIVLMGDSTFFHSGMTALSNSVQCDHNITYIILDNDNTAMTGHQMTPRTGVSVEGENRPRQNIVKLVQSLGVENVLEVNPSDRYFYKNLLSEFVVKKGTKVIISTKECSLTFQSKKKKFDQIILKENGFLPEKVFYQINSDSCEDCRVCVEMTGCPGLSQVEDAYGPKMTIDPQVCVNDGYCTKLKACPSFEKVTIKEFHLQKSLKFKAINELIEPTSKVSIKELTDGKIFRGIVIGVGGTGVTTISRVIAEAAKKMDPDLNFSFVDQKGLAQRNGSVTSHFTIYSKNLTHGQLNPLGQCDLVISPDLLEAARGMPFLSDQGLLFTDSNYQIPLSIILDKGIESDPMSEELLQEKLKKSLEDRVFMNPLKKVSYKEFGKSVYSNAMTLGIVFQEGLLPFSSKEMIDAFKRAVPKKEIDNNLLAFEIGRRIQNGDYKIEFNEHKRQREWFENSLKDSCFFGLGEKSLIELYQTSIQKALNILGSEYIEKVEQYIYDLLIYDRGKEIDQYLDDLKKLKSIYENEQLKYSIMTLTKTYFYKDEIFVAHVMSNSSRLKNDREKYSKMGKSYQYEFINRPSFDLFGKKIEFDISPSITLLRIFRHFRFIRKLLPSWHQKEQEIGKEIRLKVLKGEDVKTLKKLNAIKGYREVRFEKFKEEGL